MPARLNIEIGTRFGKLSVLAEGTPRGHRRRMECVCDCGTVKLFELNNLRTGASQSCGCLSEAAAEANRQNLAKKRREAAGVTDEGRICSSCNEFKPWSKFSRDVRNSVMGRAESCNFCHNLKGACRKFQIDVEDYLYLVSEQGGLCLICDAEPDSTKRLAIDHDHSCCGKERGCPRCIRGLLCTPCNLMLAHVETRPVLAALFSDYLRRPRPLMHRQEAAHV